MARGREEGYGRREGTLLLLVEPELEADLLAFLPQATRESTFRQVGGELFIKRSSSGHPSCHGQDQIISKVN